MFAGRAILRNLFPKCLNVRCVLRVIDVGKEHRKQQATLGTRNASRGPLVPMGPEQFFLQSANGSRFIKSNRTKCHLETPLTTLMFWNSHSELLQSLFGG